METMVSPPLRTSHGTFEMHDVTPAGTQGRVLDVWEIFDPRVGLAPRFRGAILQEAGSEYALEPAAETDRSLLRAAFAALIGWESVGRWAATGTDDRPDAGAPCAAG